jgi:predicted CXXCH cytochrome family protein
MAVQHAPFLNGDCTGCHQPHGSEYTPLLNAVQPDLCYDCHTAIETDFRKLSRHPVGGTFQCSSCHDPHAAQYMNLLAATGNGFCLQCHTQVRELYEVSSHSVVRCDRCHESHGSRFSPLLDVPRPVGLR